MRGTDSPAGLGVQPLGLLRLIALLFSLGKIPAELVSCFASGNTPHACAGSTAG